MYSTRACGHYYVISQWLAHQPDKILSFVWALCSCQDVKTFVRHVEILPLLKKKTKIKYGNHWTRLRLTVLLYCLYCKTPYCKRLQLKWVSSWRLRTTYTKLVPRLWTWMFFEENCFTSWKSSLAKVENIKTCREILSLPPVFKTNTSYRLVINENNTISGTWCHQNGLTASSKTSLW